MTDRDAVVRWYERYLSACNDREWDVIAGCVADTVLVNGVTRTREEYVHDIVATVAVFADYRWQLRRVLVDGEWLAVHLHDTGTRSGNFLDAPGDGAAVETDEFVMYRIVRGSIVEMEGTADNSRLRD